MASSKRDTTASRDEARVWRVLRVSHIKRRGEPRLSHTFSFCEIISSGLSAN